MVDCRAWDEQKAHSNGVGKQKEAWAADEKGYKRGETDSNCWGIREKRMIGKGWIQKSRRGHAVAGKRRNDNAPKESFVRRFTEEKSDIRK